MSIDYFGLAWKISFPGKPLKKLVLLCLADHHNDEIGFAWPSYKTIAHRCCISRRTVVSIIAELETDGFVTRQERHKIGNLNTSNAYYLNETLLKSAASVGESGSPSSPLMVQDDHHDSDRGSPSMVQGDHHNGDPRSPNLLINILDEPLKEGGAKSSPLPPASIRFEPADRTPGGNGVAYPSEPPVKKPDPEEDRAVAAMAAALTEVTGISAKLNWKKGFGEFCEQLVAAGYTAEQIRAHYGSSKVAGKWHWYESDWRGKKGDKPRLNEISETIAGAIAERPDQPKQENNQSWIESAVRMARANGLLPSDPSNTVSPAVS